MQPAVKDWDEWEEVALRQLAEGVKRARGLAQMSQRALADAASVDRGIIANIESLARSDTSTRPRLTELPKVAVLVRLAYALNTSPAELMYPPNMRTVEYLPKRSDLPITAAGWLSKSDGLSAMTEVWLAEQELEAAFPAFLEYVEKIKEGDMLSIASFRAQIRSLKEGIGELKRMKGQLQEGDVADPGVYSANELDDMLSLLSRIEEIPPLRGRSSSADA